MDFHRVAVQVLLREEHLSALRTLDVLYVSVFLEMIFVATSVAAFERTLVTFVDGYSYVRLNVMLTVEVHCNQITKIK